MIKKQNGRKYEEDGKMKCPLCPKEIAEDKEYLRRIGKRKCVSNPDYDKHIKMHHKPHTK